MVSILEAKKSIQEILLQRPDVIGVGLDYNKQTIRIYVNNEDVTEELADIPPMMAGFPIEIVQSPTFRQLSGGSYRTERYRPAVGGISASHPQVTAGTIGAIIVDQKTGNKLLLSNNHVFANSDALDNHRANMGDPIYQPGAYDGGTAADTIAVLYKWIPFEPGDGLNIVDAALAMPLDQNEVSPYILINDYDDLIQVRGVRSVSGKINVKKYSRTTNADRGVVVDWDFTVAVDYEDGRTHNFTDQILIQIETEGGDSGSILLDEDNYAVGLVFAGGTDSTGQWFGVANKIRTVLAMFGGDIDISEGLTETSISEPKPFITVTEMASSSVQDSGLQIGGIVAAGIGVVTAIAVWQHLNKGK